MKHLKPFGACFVAALLAAGLLAGCSGEEDRLKAAVVVLEEERQEAERLADQLQAELGVMKAREDALRSEIAGLEAELENAEYSKKSEEARQNSVPGPSGTYLVPMPQGPLVPVDKLGDLGGSWVSVGIPNAWMYHFQFNLLTSELLLTFGMAESDHGLRYAGPCQLGTDGIITATLAKVILGEEWERSPEIIVQLKAEFPAENRDLCVFTLLSIDDPDDVLAEGGGETNGLLPALNIPLPLDKYNA